MKLQLTPLQFQEKFSKAGNSQAKITKCPMSPWNGFFFFFFSNPFVIRQLVVTQRRCCLRANLKGSGSLYNIYNISLCSDQQVIKTVNTGLSPCSPLNQADLRLTFRLGAHWLLRKFAAAGMTIGGTATFLLPHPVPSELIWGSRSSKLCELQPHYWLLHIPFMGNHQIEKDKEEEKKLVTKEKHKNLLSTELRYRPLEVTSQGEFICTHGTWALRVQRPVECGLAMS